MAKKGDKVRVKSGTSDDIDIVKEVREKRLVGTVIRREEFAPDDVECVVRFPDIRPITFMENELEVLP